PCGRVRAGIDAARPDPPAWERARPLAERFDAAVFPLASFAPPGLEGVREIHPAIDPLGPRCRDLPLKLAGDSLRMLGLDLERPLCCQVGALDPWRDPHDTIDAFRLAKEEEPSLQLVLAGAPAAGDDEGWRVAGEVAAYAAGTPDLHVLTGYAGVGETELNALQRLSRAALARSVREDFAISASEALWKGTPVVAAPDGGLPEQVADGVTGLIAHTAEDTARALVELVRDPALSIVLGSAGRERVRERFLVTRLVADELELMGSLLRATVRRP
ncbi:MAG TPA: glycosyltransferase, partial [Thermoleophilaceae bacterium]|nr:glycosyltransferase [Thermoleophilaceae bacterium]